MTEFRLSSQNDPQARGDIESARRVLRKFLFAGQAADIDCPSSARGYSGASIFRVLASGRTYCLRRWPEAGLPSARLRELHYFLGHLQQSGIDVVPLPMMARGGQTLVSHEGSWWQLEPWMPGTANFNDSPTDARLCDSMQVLARVHLAAERYVSRIPGRTWFARAKAAPSPAIRERLAIIDEWTPERVDAALNRAAQEPHEDYRVLAFDLLRLYQVTVGVVQTELRSLQELHVPLHPCLRDVWHDHLLFFGNQLTGLIDPAAARTEHVAADLSRLLGSLLGDDYGRWETALAAYSAVRPLSDEERRLLCGLDRSSVLLSGLTWIDRRQSSRLKDADLARVLPRLRVIHTRLQNLAASSGTL